MDILIGILSSFIFLIFLFFYFRPSILISDYICKKMTEQGVQRYTIKMINNSYLFSLYEVKAELVYQTEYQNGEGKNTRSKRIKLCTDEYMYIPRKTKNKHNKAPFAILIHTDENIDAMWAEDHACLELKILAKHSLSGFSKVFIKQFGDKSVVLRKGKFHYGKNLDVIEER